MPEIDSQAQEDNSHLKGEQDFLGLHDWDGGRPTGESEATIAKLNPPNQSSDLAPVGLAAGAGLQLQRLGPRTCQGIINRNCGKSCGKLHSGTRKLQPGLQN